MLEKSPERPPISKRELEIARAYTDGRTYREIADDLGIAPATVRTHINNIYRKLDVSSKIELLNRIAPAIEAPITATQRNWRLPLLAALAIGVMVGMAMNRDLPARPTDRMPALALVQFQSKEEPATRDALTRGLVESLMQRVELSVVQPSNSLFGVPTEKYASRLSQALNLRYVLLGEVTTRNGALFVSAELFDQMGGQIIWRQELLSAEGDTFSLGAELIDGLARVMEIPLQDQRQTRCQELSERDTDQTDFSRVEYVLSQNPNHCQLEEIGPR